MQLAPHYANSAPPKGRSPLAHLLHALNQPLTGLQCSLELAAAGPRRTEEYIRTLREGLQLADRARILVEAIRELADTQLSDPDRDELFLLDELVRNTADDLLPIAETGNVHVLLVSPAALPVRADHGTLATVIFRFLESTLSLTREGSALQIMATREHDQACLVVSWNQGPPPDHSPFSRPELGLMIAQAGWERAGAEWRQARTETTETCTVRLPLASPLPPCNGADLEI